MKCRSKNCSLIEKKTEAARSRHDSEKENFEKRKVLKTIERTSEQNGVCVNSRLLFYVEQKHSIV